MSYRTGSQQLFAFLTILINRGAAVVSMTFSKIAIYKVFAILSIAVILLGSSCSSGDADTDGDLVADNIDNCLDNPNTDQADSDRDGIGDVCDNTVDADEDGVLDTADNCPSSANENQADLDGDGIGDACDNDDDGDAVSDAGDNCPLNPNATQLDSDGDGIGDVCDMDFADADNDTVSDTADNCPNYSNADQGDVNGNGTGDACECRFTEEIASLGPWQEGSFLPINGDPDGRVCQNSTVDGSHTILLHNAEADSSNDGPLGIYLLQLEPYEEGPIGNSLSNDEQQSCAVFANCSGF